MSRSKKDRKRGPLDHQDIGLLGAAFNLPTRRNIEMAERRAAAAAAHAPHQVKVIYTRSSKDTEISASEVSSSSEYCYEDDDSVSGSSGAQQRQRRDGSHKRRDADTIRKKERQTTRQHQPSSQSSKRKKLTKSKSLSTSSTQPFSPPVAPLLSPSATFPSFRSARAVGSRPLEHYRQPQAPFAFTTIPVAPPTQMLQCTPTATALPHPVLVPSRMKLQPQGIVAQQIQRIQAEIDSKVAMLSRGAGDSALREELTALQSQLNSTLNTVLDAKNKGSYQPPPEAAEEQRPNLQDRLGSESSHVHVSRRDESPERLPRHHLCSGCGNVRSAKFHDKHPIVPGEKLVLNYCKSCQATTSKGEETRLERYHFCFGCGIVRSKKFQRKNPRNDTDGSVLPNYCGKCTQEIQSTVGIAEASALMDLGLDVSSEGEGSLGTCSVAVQAQSEDINPEGSSPQTQSDSSLGTAEYSAGPEKLINSSRASRKKYGLSHGKRPMAVNKPLNLTHQSPPVPISLNPSPGTPYYPDRTTGSAQRRAQRSPLASLSGSGNYGPIPAAKSPAQAYRAPYVEDVKSPKTRQPTSLHSLPSQQSFERSPVPKTYRKRQSSGTKEASAQDPPGPTTGGRTTVSRADPEVHFWDSPLSGEVSSNEDSFEEGVHADGAQKSQDDVYEPHQMKQTQKRRSLFQHGHQDPLVASNIKISTESTQEPAIEEPFQKHDDTTKFWKGAFAERERGEAGAWANHITAAAERQASPSSPSASSSSSSAAQNSTRSGKSPLGSAGLSGFPPSVHKPFVPPVSNGHDEDPPLRTSKGAFGSSTFMSSPFFTQETFNETRPSSPFSSRSKNKGEKASRRRDVSDFPGPKPSQPSFRPTSSFAGFGCQFDSECFTVRDEDEPFFHRHSDSAHLGGSSYGYTPYQNNYETYCCSNPNPYYVPRKSGSFADLNRSGFRRRSCRSRAGDRFGDQKSRASRRGTPEWIPEPIIEEPSSPMGSPVQCAMLLEFNHSGTSSPVPPLSEASTESTEPDVLEISDIE